MNLRRQPEQPISVETYQAWQRRLQRIGGACQGLFAAWWLAQGLTRVAGTMAGVVAGAVAVALTVAGALATRGLAPRPRGQGSAGLERAITIATVVQIAVSSVAPIGLARLGYSQATLPVIVLTVAGLFLFLGSRVHFRALIIAAVALAVTDLAAACAGQGKDVIAWVGLSCGLLQLGIALDGFRRLLSYVRRDERGRASQSSREESRSAVQDATARTRARRRASARTTR